MRSVTCTIRVVDADGVAWEGAGENLAQAVRDLERRRRRGEPSAVRAVHGAAKQDELPEEPNRWRLTPAGEALVTAARRRAADVALGDRSGGASDERRDSQ
ncbi:MAG: hypothetical protein ACRDJN_12840 [Chloroflexota bacterium]